MSLLIVGYFVIGTWKRSWWVIATLGMGTAVEAIGVSLLSTLPHRVLKAELEFSGEVGYGQSRRLGGTRMKVGSGY
jgi:hypothetical protein